VALLVGSVVFLGLASLPGFLARDRFYEIAQRSGSKIGFLTAIKQVSSSRHMIGLVGVVLALNFCATIAGSIALYIVIYHVKKGDVAGGITLNAMNGTGFAIVGFMGIFVLRWLALNYGKRRAMYMGLYGISEKRAYGIRAKLELLRGRV
jgi:Na+/melibiose symporter-like transporter